MPKLSHTDSQGKANMVDVGHKKSQLRLARAEGAIRLGEETLRLITENQVKKRRRTHGSPDSRYTGSQTNIIPDPFMPHAFNYKGGCCPFPYGTRSYGDQ
jgi:hypothetical protein